MHLYIVRHGQSTGNITTDDVPDGVLTPLGERQAQETARRLAREGITHILSSPLVRALATASAIAESTGLRRVEVWPELQEHRSIVHRAFGRAELMRRFPLAELHHSIEADGWDHGGETYESAMERAYSALALLRAQFGKGDRVVMASHGAFGSFLLRAILRIPPSALLWFQIYNCAITHVYFVPEDEMRRDPDYPWAEIEVCSVNDMSHMAEVSY